ncbi:hypothetical protein LCGC14_1107490 [marine sediment metagenome]|uniref:YspA cpYpsA-related SLOG domain-containing protein n=1 Tax=marine sediment metagenome TaxID=412755 RepID=A0A0F9QDZ6_9ZZZZ
MRLAIVGGRDFNDYSLVRVWCDTFRHHLHIISGGAKGADSLAKKYAMERFLPYTEFPAEWDKYGKSAGFLRNQTIVNNCDMVLAFWDGQSRGTADTINKAKRAMKPTFIVYY